jgi:uncharacterized protein
MAPMKTSLDHLPPRKRLDLECVLKILFSEFHDAIARRTQPHRRNGRILKVILYGSFARGNWVDDRDTGYKSDYDILVVVDHEDLTDIIEYWSRFEERLRQDYMFTQQIRFPVGLIVHTFADVNEQLRRGRPFFIDAMRDGIALYEAPGHVFEGPQPLKPSEALGEAQGYFENWFESSKEYQLGATHAIADGAFKLAAFLLHQTTERLYHCALLVLKLYSPRSHDIESLRSRAEALDIRLVPAWPRKLKVDQGRFDLLRRAYVESRYSKHCAITTEELTWLGERVGLLRDLVETVCKEHLEAIRGAAECDGKAHASQPSLRGAQRRSNQGVVGICGI